MSSLLLAALMALASATPTPHVARDASFCSGTWDATAWKNNNMESFLDRKDEMAAMKICQNGLLPTWQSSITGWNAHDAPCGRNMGTSECSVKDLDKYCANNPEWTLAMASAINYAEYINLMGEVLRDAKNTVADDLATFPGIFAPDNKTVIAGTTPTSAAIASNALSFVAAFLGFVPGLNLVTKEMAGGAQALTSIAATNGAISVANAALTKAGLKDTAAIDTEVMFESYAKIMQDLTDFGDAVNEGVLGALDQIFLGGQNDFSTFNLDYIRKPIANGGFVQSVPVVKDLASYQYLIATLTAPAINTLWQWGGVTVLKINKNNFHAAGHDLDPCKSDWMSGVRWCDADGNAFILQKFDRSGQQSNDPNSHAVPGFSTLNRYHLSPDVVMKSSWNNQKAHGAASSGQTAQSFMDDIVKAGTTVLPLERFAFFNLLVCDVDKIDVKTYPDWKKVCPDGQDPAFCRLYNLAARCGNIPELKTKDGKLRWPGYTLTN